VASGDHRQVTTSFYFPNEILEAVQRNSKIFMKYLRHVIEGMFHHQPSYSKICCAKEKAISSLFGSWIYSYWLLPCLLNAFIITNSGTMICVEGDLLDLDGEYQLFKRATWSFGGVRQ
jgi:hypothetical protein